MLFENGKEQLVISKGNVVTIITDNTDWNESYFGEITFINVDGVSIHYSEIIPFEYIIEIIPECKA
jgi:hypothetical protein